MQQLMIVGRLGCHPKPSDLLASAPPRPVTERWGGETYRALWQGAAAAHPDYVLITSWNEWHEGSEIEPSAEYGSIMVNDTAGFARTFPAGKS